MFDDDSNQRNGGDRGQKKPPGGFKVPVSTWILWIAILGGLVALMMLKSHMTTQGDALSQSEFLQKFSSNQIVHATINFNSQIVAAYAHHRHVLQKGKRQDQSKAAVQSRRTPC